MRRQQRIRAFRYVEEARVRAHSNAGSAYRVKALKIGG